MAIIKKITFLSSFLAIFNTKSNILAKFSGKVFISKIQSIITSKHLKSISLSIICSIYLYKIS